MGAITAAAFAVRYWFNFHFPHLNAFNSCDASEYLANAQALIQSLALPRTFWADALACLSGHAAPDVVSRLHAQLAPLNDLRISGPIFPLFLAASLAIAGSANAVAQWASPVFFQSLLSAITCLFIGLTAARVFSKRAGYLAATTAAVYPAFIINSGRLYSETFAAFLLSCLCYLTVRGFTAQLSDRDFSISSAVNGVVAACLQLTRSAMVAVTLVTVPCVIFQQGARKGCFGLIGFIIGFWLIIMPWLAFQKVAFGSASLVVDRVSHYNMFVGNNTMTQGWLSVPYPDGRGIEDKSLPELLKDSYRPSPSHFFGLLLDKQLRFWKSPWNDFRTPLGRITYPIQVWWHEVVLLLASVGITLGFVANQRSQEDDYDFDGRRRKPNTTAAKFFLLTVLAIHFAYLFFITVPRYNLTAMAIVCMFAGAGLDALGRLMDVRNGPAAVLAILATGGLVIAIPKVPAPNIAATLAGGNFALVGLIVGNLLCLTALLCLSVALFMAVSAFVDRQFGQRPQSGVLSRVLIVVLTIIFAPSFLLHTHASGRWYEWQCPMDSSGETITQTFTLPADFNAASAGRQLYLIVDADSGTKLQNQVVTVNGVTLDEPAIPSLSLIGDLSRYQVVHDQTIMHEVEWIFLSLCQPAGIATTDLRQWYIYPLPNNLLEKQRAVKVQLTAAGDAAATIFGEYNVQHDSVAIPAVDFASWEKAFYGVENDYGFSDPRYDTRISSLAATSYDSDPAPGMQPGRYNIHLLAGPAVSLTETHSDDEQTPKEKDTKNGAPLQSNAKDKQDAVRKDNTTDSDSDAAPKLPPASPTAASVILEKPLTLNALPVDTQSVPWTQNQLPSYKDDDFWIVRISGTARRQQGSVRLTVDVSAAGQGTQLYQSPWSAPARIGPQWTTFNMAVPIQPGTLSNHPNRLFLNFGANSSNLQAGASNSDSTLELRNVKLQVWRLPANPVAPGHIIY